MPVPMSLDYLIVGAGLHGVHLALALLGGAKVERERLRLLDPHPRPLAFAANRTCGDGGR